MKIRFPTSAARLLRRAFPIFGTKLGSGLRAQQDEMTEVDYIHLMENLNFHHMNCAENMVLLRRFSTKCREEFAFRSKSLVVYMPEEAGIIIKEEEEAALRAVPRGFSLEQLNGINIGCGDRRISEYLTPVDLMRKGDDTVSGSHHAFLKDAILANPEDLPFRESSVDYIVALHMLEHVANPVEVLKHWSAVLKPGGGVGLVLPNFEYTWNAKGDHSQFGHKWNTSAEIFQRLYEEHLKNDFILERIGTLSCKISFDVVLRKPGEFKPFKISNVTSPKSGAELSRLGAMVSDTNSGSHS